MSTDEHPTVVQCPACGGDTRRDCSLCLGVGWVSEAVAAAWRFRRAGRIASGEQRLALPSPREPLPHLPDEGHRDDPGPKKP